MREDSTQNKIILNAYSELDALDQLALIEAIEADTEAKSYNHQIGMLKESLDQGILSAHPTSLKIIMEEAARNESAALEEI